MGPMGDKEEVPMSYTPNPPLDPLPWAYAEAEHREREGCGGVALLSSQHAGRRGQCKKDPEKDLAPGNIST